MSPWDVVFEASKLPGDQYVIMDPSDYAMLLRSPHGSSLSPIKTTSLGSLLSYNNVTIILGGFGQTRYVNGGSGRDLVDAIKMDSKYAELAYNGIAPDGGKISRESITAREMYEKIKQMSREDMPNVDWGGTDRDRDLFFRAIHRAWLRHWIRKGSVL